MMVSRYFIYFCALYWTNAIVKAQESSLKTAKQWKTFSYNFLPEHPVADVNFYNPNNILSTGIAISKDRIFVATPKLFSGVPSTVNVVSKATFGDSPVLQAYPDWSFSTTGRKDFNCSELALVSVYRMRIDSCNRLWVLDAGVSRSLEDYEITCPPKILIIDLNINQVVRRVDFPREILRGETLFTNLVIDETTSKSGTCDDVFAYITDTVEPAIVVYDSERDVTWRVSHPSMYPDPDFAQSEILSDRFILMDGVVGLTFDAKAGKIYFQPLATDRVFSVDKNVLRAGPLAQNQMLDVKLVGKKSSQGIGMAVSPIDGSLIISPLTETALASWNPYTNEQKVLAFDQDRLQFIGDMSTDEHGYLYVISSKFQRFFLKNLNTNEYNNRILRIKLPGSTVPSYSHIPPYHSAIPPHFAGYFIPPSSHHSHISTPPASNALGELFYNGPLPNPQNFRFQSRHPFTALNQGEAFPPSKETRDKYQPSFLDNLQKSPSTGYLYNRPSRSIKKQAT